MNKTLEKLTEYMEENPSQRFWQALRNISEYNFIRGAMTLDDKGEDTFYKE